MFGKLEREEGTSTGGESVPWIVITICTGKLLCGKDVRTASTLPSWITVWDYGNCGTSIKF